MATIAELLKLALLHHHSGNLRQAEAHYRQVLHLDPAHAAANHLLGLVAHQTGRQETALALIRQAIALDPAAAVFHFNLGIVHKELGQPAEAAQCYREALRLDPHNVDALCNLGVIFRDQGQVSEAVTCYRQVLRINPNHAETYNNLGNALKDQGQLDEAANCFRQALANNPRYANAHYNLGILLKDQGQLAEAAACFRQALASNPRHADAHNNLGVSLMYLGRLPEARDNYEQALRAHPGNPTALWNRSLLRLLEGDFEGGWPDYEFRWTQPGFVPRHLDRPRWDGGALVGKTILLHAEQGLGDTIQFIRYAALIKERGGTVLVECQPALECLLTGARGIDQLVPAGAPLPPYDVQAPLLSLPGILGTTPATIPATVPYLRADAGLIERWRRELAPLGGFKVGIAWQGSLTYRGDRYRSIPLRNFEALARVAGVRLVSLQKGPGVEQISEVRSRKSEVSQTSDLCPPTSDLGPPTSESNQVRFPIIDLSDRLDAAGAFLDTAAVVMNLDLVVTSDTALAHLAGALGVPVWVALSTVPDWRWLLERTDSPWYPTMRLFRQRHAEDWGEVFERCAAEIQGLIDA